MCEGEKIVKSLRWKMIVEGSQKLSVFRKFIDVAKSKKTKLNQKNS